MNYLKQYNKGEYRLLQSENKVIYIQYTRMRKRAFTYGLIWGTGVDCIRTGYSLNYTQLKNSTSFYMQHCRLNNGVTTRLSWLNNTTLMLLNEQCC